MLVLDGEVDTLGRLDGSDECCKDAEAIPVSVMDMLVTELDMTAREVVDIS